jgi:F-type H+-transporting ATPase subunit gamma
MEEDVSKDLAEFALANAIYTALVEGHAAEISARRTAMENASNVGLLHIVDRPGANALFRMPLT